MTTMEIVLLIAGGIVFVLSFLIPAKKGAGAENTKEMAKEEIRELVSSEIGQARGQVDEAAEAAVSHALEKTERALERLSNEKIMAVNEYSDTVLEQINKNHQEVMFLYDMLNDKHENIKSTAAEVANTIRRAEETAREAEAAVREAVNEAEAARRQEEKLSSELQEQTERIERSDRGKTSEAGRAEAAVRAGIGTLAPQGISGRQALPAASAEMPQDGSPASAAEMRGAGGTLSGPETGKEGDTVSPVEKSRAGGSSASTEAREDGDTAAAPEMRNDDGEASADLRGEGEAPASPKQRKAANSRLKKHASADASADTGEAADSGNGPRQRNYEPAAGGSAAAGTESCGLRVLPAEAAAGGSAANTEPVKARETPGMDISFIRNADNQGKNSNERILELYNQGKSKVAIAKELGLGVGEVKLVIDLYKNM